jgi:hypothetical protein
VKKIAFISFLFLSLRATAQQPLSYAQLLENTIEIELSDSLFLSAINGEMKAVDSFTVKKWFAPALTGSPAIKLKNKDYYQAGKITCNDNFDLHVLVENRKKTDSSGIQVIHLITTKKEGTYISSFKAAITGTKKKSSYNTSSWLYKGFNIIQDSRITTSTASLADVTQYKINNTGRFIMYSSQ